MQLTWLKEKSIECASIDITSPLANHFRDELVRSPQSTSQSESLNLDPAGSGFMPISNDIVVDANEMTEKVLR